MKSLELVTLNDNVPLPRSLDGLQLRPIDRTNLMKYQRFDA